MTIPTIQTQDIPYGTRVLVRASLNVPVENGKVMSTFRIRETVRTLRFLREKGARVTVIGHLGRNGESLAPVHRVLNDILPVSFVPKLTGEEPYQARKQLKPGDVLLLENTRTDRREETSDILFIEEIAAQTDIFVFDDFSAAHRSHASTTGLIRFLPSYAGIRFYEEITAILRITERLIPPAIAILSGAKCETKIPLLAELVKRYDAIFIGGVIANTLLKLKGYNIGASKTEEVSVPDELLKSTNIILPQEVIVMKDDKRTRTVAIEEIQPDDAVVDMGNKTLNAIQYHLETAKTVVWNGPLGWYEKGFFKQTAILAKMIAGAEAYSFIGGGDTAALLEQQNLLDDYEFVSTGGGSLLTYFSKRTLPVLEAFKEKTGANVKPPSLTALQ